MTTGEGHLMSRNGSDGEFSDRVPEAESKTKSNLNARQISPNIISKRGFNS